MSWLETVIGTPKPIIAMCHLQPLPGDPHFDRDGGMERVVDVARADLQALQKTAWMLLCFPTNLAFPILQKLSLSL